MKNECDPKVINGDFFKEYHNHILPSSVDLFLSDIPYGIFNNNKDLNISKNDPEIDLKQLENILDIIMAKNSNVLLFCDLDLLIKFRETFTKFEYRFNHVLIKSMAMPTSKTRPLNNVEYVAVFKRKNTAANDIIFNPYEGIIGKPYSKNNYNLDVPIRNQKKRQQDVNRDGRRWVKTAIPMQSKCNLPVIERSLKHPFQKPEKILRMLIKIYSTQFSLIVDGFAGSASTLISSYRENRRSVGFEIDPEFYQEALNRINEVTNQTQLF